MWAALLIILATSTFSETLPSGATIGATMIEDKMYYQTTIFKDVAIGKVGLGIGLLLRWNEEEGIRKEDWRRPKDILQNLIRYVRYGEKGAPFYVRVGMLDAATIGTGFLFYNYQNYDAKALEKRKIGTEADISLPFGGAEVVVDDIFDTDLLGARIYATPFREEEFLKNLQLGITYAICRDFFGDEELVVYGADIILPLAGRRLFAYTDSAKVKERDWGQAIGLGGHLSPSLFYKVEHRRMGKGFVPQVFGPAFESSKHTLESRIKDTGEIVSGWYAELGLLTNLLDATIAYQGKMNGMGATLFAKAKLKQRIAHLLSFEASFRQTDVERLFRLKEEGKIIADAVFVQGLLIRLREGVGLLYQRRQIWRKGEREPVFVSSMSVQILF